VGDQKAFDDEPDQPRGTRCDKGALSPVTVCPFFPVMAWLDPAIHAGPLARGWSDQAWP
jgi:hypothetical protein